MKNKENMLNFRKLKQDFSSSILKEGKMLHGEQKVAFAKILKLDSDVLRISAKVAGNFKNTYESEIEIDRFESQTIHSNCDCTYRYDCRHIAALVFYLEEHIDSLIVKYSKGENFSEETDNDLLKKIDEARSKEIIKRDKNYQKEVLDEYITSSSILSYAPFFKTSKETIFFSKAEVSFIFNPQSIKSKMLEFQIALRVPTRSKPLQITNLKHFFSSLRYEEKIQLGGRNYFFSLNSFDLLEKKIMEVILNRTEFLTAKNNEKEKRVGKIDAATVGEIFFEVFSNVSEKRGFSNYREDLFVMPCFFIGNLETPLQCSFSNAEFNFDLEYIEPPASKILLNPTILIDQTKVSLENVVFLKSKNPGVICQDIYYRFLPHIKRFHIQYLPLIREMTIPEPLFGTFVENSIVELKRYATISNEDILDNFVTIPYVSEVKGKCRLLYVDGELEAFLSFIYEDMEVPNIFKNLEYEEIQNFVTENGILARNLVEEKKIIDGVFQDFIFNEDTGSFIAKSEKKIVEFMTETIVKYKEKVKFECPQNLLDQFVYDKTLFFLDFSYEDKVGYYSVDLKVKGDLKNVKIDRLWECMVSTRSYIELHKDEKLSKSFKILVLDLFNISKLVQIFDEIGVKKLQDQKIERPLWSLVNIDETLFKNLPVKFSMSSSLKEIRKEMVGKKKFNPSDIPSSIKAKLRPYQKEGVYWLERLRSMYLNGILADDMGLGKTLQAIVAIEQSKKNNISIVVCPTSLLHNWKEEFHKFSPNLKIKVIEGIPNQRKKIISKIKNFDAVITSYSLIQKDVELYKDINFTYVILDEAQHIKNKNTRNARSVKLLKGVSKLILTGTPIENSLDELWSLFDFLMPGFLSSYDRFLEKYIRVSGKKHLKNMEYLRRKTSPFIMRRMKEDVLKDLPSISEIVYYVKLSGYQLDLYQSYAKSAKEELSKLVEKEGFEKVQMHVLATLTRLKQICCHPAIFAKEKAEMGDSAKYEMLVELLQNLVENNHKTVIFSQYTKMLQIMRADFEQRKINFCYLDGSIKNRLEIVKQFNEDPTISVFLVSLKAGGIGLNITGADTVIHYDMWWNPAVENQATDRVHRIGQKKSVLCYKLITLNSIEEKILELQKRKKGLVKKVVSCDDEAMYKLTWKDVLDLLQT